MSGRKSPTAARRRKAGATSAAEDPRVDGPLLGCGPGDLDAVAPPRGPVRGTRTGITPVWLPRSAVVACVRAETGTEMTRAGARSPRCSRSVPRAPLTAASITSFTVAPWAWATSRIAASSASTVVTRRRGTGRHVQGGPRRGIGPALAQLGQGRPDGGRAGGDPAHRAQPGLPGIGEQLPARGLRSGLVDAVRFGAGRSLVDQGCQDCETADAIGHDVVQDEDDGSRAVGEVGDQHGPPQRPRPDQRAGDGPPPRCPGAPRGPRALDIGPAPRERPRRTAGRPPRSGGRTRRGP